jgi:hypothetical protein
LVDPVPDFHHPFDLEILKHLEIGVSAG